MTIMFLISLAASVGIGLVMIKNAEGMYGHNDGKTLGKMQNFREGIVAGEDSVVFPGFDEPLQSPDGVITNVLSTFFIYDTREELQSVYRQVSGYTDEVDGFSMCERNVEKNVAWCDIYIIRPTIVDGFNSAVAGHEVLHGVYGQHYHE